jgi:hypothetical protein
LIGSGVLVGIALCPPGGRTLSDEFGLMKITRKYPAIQTVNISTMIVRISHIFLELLFI